tara:strand:- start:4395 stop:5705 length:1311 start_codon:yes stop_codon:yes gene_type:complete
MSTQLQKSSIFRIKSHIGENMPNKDIQWPMYRIPYSSYRPNDGSDHVTLEIFEGWSKEEVEELKNRYLKAMKQFKESGINKKTNYGWKVLVPTEHFYSIDEKCDKLRQTYPGGDGRKCIPGLNRVTHISYPMNRKKLHSESVYEPYRLLAYDTCFDKSVEEFLADPDFPNKSVMWMGLPDDEKGYLESCVQPLKTIFELHKKNISCMKIEEDNVFVKCFSKHFSPRDLYNFFVLGGKHFQAFDSTEDMFKECFVSGDYFHYLRIILLVYAKLLHKGKVEPTNQAKDEKQLEKNRKSQQAAFDKIKKVEGGTPIKSWSDETQKKKLNKAVNSVLHVKDKSLVNLLLNALHACASNELHDMTPRDETVFYNKYIKPIVEFFDGSDKAAEKKHKEVFHHTNMLGFGGRKLRRRKRTKKRRKSRRKSKRKRKRTKKRRRR